MATPIAQFRDMWRGLTAGKQAVIIAGAIATLGLIGAVVYYGSQPDYQVLFTDLKAADAEAIVDKLKTSQVSYKLGGGGGTIYVPSEQVTELRLQMASSGTLSSKHVGFDIFDKTSFGATDFTQQVNYQRALEGELARTLESMSEVESARVHITKSRESVFIDKAEPAKASVMLTLKGRELNADRAEAIVGLVASAVEGLDPENVTVMDNAGRMLSGKRGKKGSLGGGDFDGNMDVRRKFESDTSDSLVALLEPVTGPGHVKANVAADIDFSQVEQTEETYDPKSSVIRTQQTTQESKNGPANSGGVAGTRANDPQASSPPQTTNSTLPGNSRSASSVTYEINKVTKRTVGNGGKVSRINVSVLVDSTPPKGKIIQPADIQKKVEALVATAVGIDPARGDKVTVEMIPFQDSSIEMPAAPVPTWMERNREIVKTGIKYGLLVLVAILIILFIIRPARRALQAVPQQTAGQLLLAAGSDGSLSLPESQLEMVESHHGSDHGFAQLSAADRELEEEEPVTLPHKITPEMMMRHDLVRLTQDDPTKVAMAVRSWLQDEKS